ncbi:MAG: hypothetical protein GY869_23965, partial [Planctomycetes bacterium]|nr:hypothetical protein [Planctomycetota bacterium]
NEVAVGLTVLVVMILTVYIVIALGDWSNMMTDKQYITVEIPYKHGLKGLDQGSPIFLGGVKIGQITQTWIAPPVEDKVNVLFTMEIPQSYQLYKNCTLAAQSNVLGGAASLAIKNLGKKESVSDGDTILVDGEPDSPKFDGGITDAIDNISREFDAEIPGTLMHNLKYQMNPDLGDSILASLIATAANLKQITQKIDLEVTPADQQQTLMTKVHSALDHLDEITRNINHQFDAEDQQTIIAKVNGALDTLIHSLDEVDQLIVTNKEPLTQTIADLQTAVENITPFLEKATAGAESFQTAMTTLEELTADTKDLITINRDYISSMILNLNEISVNFKMASRDIRRSPWKLLYTPDESELKIQGLIEAADDFATGAEQLDDAAQRLQNLMTTGAADQIPVDKKIIETIINDLKASFDKFQNAENKFWTEIK